MKYRLIGASFFLLSANIAQAADTIPASIGQQTIHECTLKNEVHLKAEDCEEKVNQELSKKMQDAYNQALVGARERDSYEVTHHEVAYKHEAILKASQDTFKNYLDKECDRQAKFYAGGTGETDLSIGCEIDLKNDRITMLKRMYRGE